MPPPVEGLASRLFLGPALRTQSDRRLVTLVREGYEAAFEEIVRRYAAPLRRYATAIVGGNAEDVTQDSFSKALLALRRSDAEIELRPWLYRIVRNTALNDLRDRPLQAEALAEEIAAGRTPAEDLEQREELADLMGRLQALPEAQRAAIVMRELEGLSHDEIAAALGISGGAARQAIHRARTALRDGVGMLLPLPLLRILIDHGPEAVAAGLGVGGAGAAAGGALGGAGAGTALKAGVVTAVLAGSVGTGLALNEDRGKRAGEAVPAAATATAEPGPTATPSSSPGPASGDSDDGDDDEKRDDSDERRRDGSGDGEAERDDDSGHGRRGSGGSGSGKRHSGPSRSADDRDDDSSHSGSGRRGSRSGPGGGGHDDDDDDDRSGHGDGDDDHPSGHSGGASSPPQADLDDDEDWGDDD